MKVLTTCIMVICVVDYEIILGTKRTFGVRVVF